MALALKGFDAECQRQTDLAMFTAWQCERLARVKKLKPLKDYLAKPPARGARQSADAMLEAVLSMTAGKAKVRKLSD